MSKSPDQIPPLPRVASPPGWSWNYFRMRYLPVVTSGVAIVTAVWLWAMNLPESSSGAGAVPNVARPTIPNAERHAGELLRTNMPNLHTSLTNGNLSTGGGLVEND